MSSLKRAENEELEIKLRRQAVIQMHRRKDLQSIYGFISLSLVSPTGDKN